MIVPRLKGGLGNQLFQIATAYAQSKIVGTDFAINYNLENSLGAGNKCHHYKDTLYKNIPETDYIPSNVYNEPNFSYNKITDNKDLLLDGYFQSEKYFKEFKSDLKDLFEFPSNITNRVDNHIKSIDKDIITIHVRRGDYLDNIKIHIPITEDYYDKALKAINNNSALKILATDDINTVSREFKDIIQYTYSNGKSELEDLYILTKGKYFIGCNSSFSWWAAYLGNFNKIFFPKVWFGENGPQDYNDVYNSNFIKI